YVLVQNSPALPALRRLQEEGEPIKLITFAKWAGESGALSAGFARASGQVIVTLPSEYQVDASHIGDVIRALEGCDMAIARRHPRKRSGLGTMQQRIFNSMLQRFADAPFRDISCDVRAMKRVVAEELVLYGEQYRFLPLLAQGQGFSVQEVEIPPSEKSTSRSVHPVGKYLRSMLDVLSIIFLVKFSRKPLRFFGMIGLGVFGVGSLWTLFILAERLFGDQALMERPALILSVLLVVLGIQIIAVGLVGEILIFTRSKDLKEYKIAEVIEQPRDAS
ncbi:MAG: glycosyltransferase, partial [Rhodospirillales bacterium]|nr:glycosyltransferase [Rhodospirillales bacterium]